MSEPSFSEHTEMPLPAGETPTQPQLFTPEINVLLLTWVTFFALLAILYKFAWKPILAGLDKREEGIRRSVDEAEKIHGEYEKVEEEKKKILNHADQEAKGIILQSRKAAVVAANVVEQKAKEEAQILLENAQREIKAEVEKAESSLRQKSVEMVMSLASRLVQENLDSVKNRKLVEKALDEI